MTTGRINQVCQMLLLTALFHERMDQRRQTAARNSKLFTTQSTALEHAFKPLPSKRNSLLDDRRTSPWPRYTRTQAPFCQLERGRSPRFAKSHRTQGVVMTTKCSFGRLRTGTATVEDQTSTCAVSIKEGPSGLPDPGLESVRLTARAAPLTSLYITGRRYPTAPRKNQKSKNLNSFFKNSLLLGALKLKPSQIESI